MRIIRPRQFELDSRSTLSRNLVFAGLGNLPFTKRMWDSSRKKNNGTLTNMDPSTDWVFVPELGRWGCSCTANDARIVCPTRTVSQERGSFACWYTRTLSAYDFMGIFNVDNLTNNSSHELILYTSTSYTPIVAFYPNLDQSESRNWSFGQSWDNLCALNTPVHIAVTWDEARDEIRGYINGKIYGSSSGSGGWRYAAWTASEIVAVGDNATVTGAASPGIITDPMMYDYAISGSDIADLADPSNTYLSGLIKGRPRTTYFIFGQTSTPSLPSFKPWFANHSHVL